jgi:hypothetical protein
LVFGIIWRSERVGSWKSEVKNEKLKVKRASTLRQAQCGKAQGK